MIFYLYFIIFALAAALAAIFLNPRARRFLLVAVILCMSGLAAYILSGAPLGSAAILTLLENIGLPPIELAEHPYSRIAAFGFIISGAMALLYGLDAAKPAEQAVALAGIAGAVGIVFSNNFITLFIFWELLTVSTSGLIILKNTPQSIVAGYKFLLFHLTGGLLLLLGIAEHYTATGSFALVVPEAGVTFFTLAVGFKAAFLPFHVWVAWGYPSASFTASVVLAGLTTKIGIYALARIIPPSSLITFIGASMACFGFSCALLQKDLRRLLSYHIISQVGYMVAAVSVGTAIAVDAGLLHMVNNMFYKGLLFMSAGALIYSTGSGNVKELMHMEAREGEVLQPVWKVLPIATIGAVVGSLAIAGAPLFSGYLSKYLVKKAMYGAGLPEYMLLVAGIGTSISFFKFMYFGFVKPRIAVNRPTTKSMNTAILLVSAACILIGAFPALIEPIMPSQSLQLYSYSGILGSLQFILAGLLIFILMNKILEKGIKVPPWVSIEYVLYLPLTFCSKMACEYTTLFDKKIDSVYTSSSKSMYKLAEKTAMFDGAIDGFYKKSATTARRVADSTRSFDKNIDDMYERSGSSLRRVAEGTRQFDHGLNDFYDTSGETLRRVAEGTTRFEEGINTAYDESGRVMRRMADGTKQFDASLNDIYDESGRAMREMAEDMRQFEGDREPRKGKKGGLLDRVLHWTPADFNIKNLNFDTLLLAVMLAIFLIVLVYFSAVQ